MIISFCQNCRKEFFGDKKKILCDCGSIMFVYHNKIDITEITEEIDEDDEDDNFDYFFGSKI